MPTTSTITKQYVPGESTTVGGQFTMKKGIYTITIPNTAGCDSVITLGKFECYS